MRHHAASMPLTLKLVEDERERVGILEVRTPIPDGQEIVESFQIVQADIQMLIGAEVLNEHGFVLNFRKPSVNKGEEESKIILHLQHGHIFLRLHSRDICYTEA